MNYKKLLFILLLGGAALVGEAQIQRNYFKTFELYAGIGSTLYFGDIGGKDSNIKGVQSFFDNLEIDLWRARPLLTGGVRYSMFKKFTASLQLTPLWISGSDQRSDHRLLNRSFNSLAAEVHLQAEYYFTNRLTTFSPYILAGLGEMVYSYWRDVDHDFSKQNNCTDFLFGFGLHFPPTNGISHALEFAYHFIGTDLIDGYKIPGTSNDLLFTTTYKINFELTVQHGK